MTFSTLLTATLVTLGATTSVLTMPVVAEAATSTTSDAPRYKLLEHGQVAPTLPGDGPSLDNA